MSEQEITREELQEIQDLLDGKSLLDDDGLLYWMKKDLQKLLTAYTAARADGIEAARDAVRETPHNHVQDKVEVLLDAMERIDALTADTPDDAVQDGAR